MFPTTNRSHVRALAAAVSFGLLIASTASTAGAATAIAPRVAGVQAAPSGTSPNGRQTRFIVRYRSGSAPMLSASSALSSARNALVRSGLTASRPGLSVRRVRRLATGADVIAVSKPLDAVATATLLRTLRADPAVAYVEADRRLYHTGSQHRYGPDLAPNDPVYGAYQWHYSHSVGGMYAPGAWDTATGTGVVVAVLDTGVVAHPDLDANLLPGYDFISDAFVSRRGSDARAAGAHDYGDWNDDPDACPVSDSSFHGTHTAGTVAEVTNNGIGLAGVAHNAKVLPVRVLGRCGGYTSDIADAIVWASGGTVAGVPANANPAEVINMSLGGEGACDATMQAAIDTAVANGTTVVVSGGNSNADAAGFSPASCNNVITVGATGIKGGKAFYSNYGTRIDLSAPGGNGQEGVPYGYVWQTGNDSLTSPELGSPVYVGMIGTSMAAPHVSATVALLQSVAKTPLAPAQVETTLKATARPFPVALPSGQPMGSGILNAKAALATLVPCQGADCEGNARALANRVPVKGLSGAAGSERLFAITVPLGATGLSFLTYGGTGDVTLLVRYGQTPIAGAVDVTSMRPGNNETARIAVTRAGTYYVKVVGTKAYTGVTLEARHY
ncbi:S8 family peptidase [Lysobacter yangpyeongensis]|uniref:S8 family peptidase n=1 Tax=Lysobacter yangpyeongensis TaxID=346182 RepID=A0ABW0SMB7_9GAMM